MTGPLTLLYDGDCGFCTRSVRWGERRARPAVRLTPWQRLAERLPGATLAAARDAVVLTDAQGAVLATGADAIAEVLATSPLRRWRLAGRLLRCPPVRPAAGRLYSWVARNRHRLPAGAAACVTERTPQPPGRDGTPPMCAG